MYIPTKVNKNITTPDIVQGLGETPSCLISTYTSDDQIMQMHFAVDEAFMQASK